MALISYALTTSLLVVTIITFSDHGNSLSILSDNDVKNNEATQNGNELHMTAVNEDDRLSARDEKLLKELVNAVRSLDPPVPSSDSPVRTLDSSVPSIDSPVRTLDSPIRTLDSPIRTLDSPVRTLDSPVRTLDSPYQTLDSPVRTLDSPVRSLDSPIRTLDSPVRTFDSPIRTFDSPIRTLNSPVRTSESSSNRKNVEGELNDGSSENDSGSNQKTDSDISDSNNDKDSVPDSKSNPNIDFNLHNGGADSDAKLVTKQPVIDIERQLSPSEERPLESESGTKSIEKDVLNEQAEDVLSQKDNFYTHSQQESDMEGAIPPEEEPFNEEHLSSNKKEGFDEHLFDSNENSDTDMEPPESIPDDDKTDFVDNSEMMNSENLYRDPIKNTPYRDELVSEAIRRADTNEYNNNDRGENDGDDADFSRHNDGNYDENNDWRSNRRREDNYLSKKKRLDYFLNNLKYKSKTLDSLNHFNPMTRGNLRYRSNNDNNYYNV